MSVLKKADIQAPILAKETVSVPELGGDVIVTGLLLKDRLELFSLHESGNAQLSNMLAATVIDADGIQVFTAPEWETFGASNFSAVINLFNVARRLSGLDAELAAKN